MNDEILKLLADVEREHGVKVLYACESGSRAWGFASPDSDYDIRFLYRRPESSYARVFRGDDTIEIPIKEDLDPGGWDISKAAALLAKSNGALVEWLHSPIIYQAEEGFLELWRESARALFSPRAAAAHYLGLARQIWLGKCQREQVRAKDYLYVLRALFCAEWILSKGVPAPVDFSNFEPGEELFDHVSRLLAWKSASAESEGMGRVGELDRWIEDSLTNLSEAQKAAPPQEGNREEAERLFRQTLHLNERQKFSSAAAVRLSSRLLFDSVAGSRAYGTAVEGSDEDRRGVFVASSKVMESFQPPEQISDAKSDEVYYELRRFGELLVKNNPNALELLAMPEDCIRFQHPAFGLLRPELFLSKLSGQTFAGYAMGQIRKARGLNKKIVNPEPEKRKDLLDFCHVLVGQGSVPAKTWLVERGWYPRNCGLVGVNHAPGTYAIFHDESGQSGYRGLLSPKDDAALVCSSVPREALPAGWLQCNEDAFKAHCRNHREYWEWVELRNEERYRTNTDHGRGYDSKNLMHTLRLLDMAQEIASEGLLRVRRPDREWLLRVRAGEFEYDELVSRAEEKVQEVEEAFARCGLPERPVETAVEEVLAEIRAAF